MTLVYQLSDVRTDVSVLLLVFPLESRNVAGPTSIMKASSPGRGIHFLFAKCSRHSHRDVFTLFL